MSDDIFGSIDRDSRSCSARSRRRSEGGQLGNSGFSSRGYCRFRSRNLGSSCARITDLGET